MVPYILLVTELNLLCIGWMLYKRKYVIIGTNFDYPARTLRLEPLSYIITLIKQLDL